MAKLLTFSQACARLASIITTDITAEDAVQEAVDRIFELGRFPGTTEEIELTADMFSEDANGYQILTLDDEKYNGAVGFRCLSGGWGIVAQESLYRDGVNSGDLEFVDLESTSVLDADTQEYTRVRKYRAPLGFNPSSGGPFYALMKLEPPTLAGDDYVPVESLNALKMAVMAVSYEDVGDDKRAEEHWAKFDSFMSRSTRQTDGPKKRRIGTDSSLRRRPRQFR
jgi:hypothetical protein